MKRNKTFKRLGVAGAHDGLNDQYDCKKDKGMWNERTKKERSDANDFFAIEFSKLIDGSGFVMDY